MIDFSTAGTGHEYLREGWGELGVRDCWTVGNVALVECPAPIPGADHLLKLSVAEVFAPRMPRLQRVTARVNGTVVGQVVCRAAGTLEFFVPAAVAALRQPLDIRLELPDARRPVDFGPGEDIRFLALRLTRLELLTLPAADLGRGAPPASLVAQRAALMDMQSLGINCEFGFLQRSVGAEPMGLFRWTDAPLAKLVPAIERGFAGLTDPEAMRVHMNDVTEFIVEDLLYGFRHHSFLFAAKGGTLAEVKRNEYLRVRMLTESLLDEMRTQRKLFVYHDAGESQIDEVRRLVAALRRHGPNTLLWLVAAGAGVAAGTVRFLEPGLIQGCVSGFQLPVWEVLPVSPYHESWLDVACRAHALWREGRA